MDRRTDRAFVVNRSASPDETGRVSVFKASTGVLVRSVVVGRDPVCVLVDEPTQRVFVVNRDSNSVSVLDARTGLLLRTVVVGSDPAQVAMDAQSGYLVVTGGLSGRSVTVLDGHTGRVIPTFATLPPTETPAPDPGTAAPLPAPQPTSAPTATDTPTATPTATDAPPPTSTAPPSTPTPLDQSAAMAEMLDLINTERARAGLGPLSDDGTLDAIARARSRDMLERHYFSHHIPGAGTVKDILDRDHVPYDVVGENIARNNYLTYYLPAQVVQRTNADFMRSHEHRANILEPTYTQIGLGMALEQHSGMLILTEVFVRPRA